MRIAIDIDDTSYITCDSMLKYADKYDREDLHKAGITENFPPIRNRFYLQELFGWDAKTKFNFFAKYYKSVIEDSMPMPGAAEVIRKLHEDGHEIYFVTARLTTVEGCDAKAITEKSFERDGIYYDVLVVNVKDKKTYCVEHGIDLIIEDSIDTCEEVSKEGIIPILVTTKMNREIDTPVQRVDNWDEIYEIIRKLNKTRVI